MTTQGGQTHNQTPTPNLDELLAPPFTDHAISYKSLRLKPLPPIEWFIPRMIPNPALVAFTGAPGSYKTFLLHSLALRLSEGLPALSIGSFVKPPAFLTTPPKTKINTLFIEEEMNERQIQQRIHDIASPMSAAEERFHWLLNQSFSLQNPQKVQELRLYVESNNIKLLILDPFSTISGMKDENSNAEAAKTMDTLRKNFVDTPHGATVIFIHHPSKSSNQFKSANPHNIRGAGDILGKCDMHFTVEKNKSIPNQITVSCGKSRLTVESPSFVLELIKTPDGLEWHFKGETEELQALEEEMMESRILTALTNNPGSKRITIAEIIDVPSGHRRFRKAWNLLMEEEQIIKSKGGFIVNPNVDKNSPPSYPAPPIDSHL